LLALLGACSKAEREADSRRTLALERSWLTDLRGLQERIARLDELATKLQQTITRSAAHEAPHSAERGAQTH